VRFGERGIFVRRDEEERTEKSQSMGFVNFVELEFIILLILIDFNRVW
jgi:hypothetical protein